jgi:GrpB-like predicted nucleotidyltransferase (UPF0157 family)
MTNLPIDIESYNPDWPSRFQTLKRLIEVQLGTLIKEIHHVGSTAVPGLSAKPVIDLDIILNDYSQLNLAIDKLNESGYLYKGEMGITGRHAFSAMDCEVKFLHHLYICDPDSDAFKNHICLRNFLRSNAKAAVHYGKLKQQLAESNGDDMNAYVQGKTAFITKILAEAGFQNSALDSIRKENTFDS